MSCTCPLGRSLKAGNEDAFHREREAQRIADDLMSAASKADLMVEENYD